MFKKRYPGFALLELITVLLIVGVLTAVALPSYQQYIMQSKLSEAYRIIGGIQKNEIAFFLENKEFFDLFANPTQLNQPMVIAADAEWARIGYPAPVGSSTYFTYKARAGKIDSGGSQITTSTLTGNSFATVGTATLATENYSSPAVTCNGGLLRATTMGAVSQPNYDWLAIVAVGDLKNNRDNLCTAVGLLIDVPGNDSPRSRGGFIVLNAGN